ncbi:MULTISPECIES: MgtC/SapB family protein [Phenylobacterium]|uniref:Protein MgtC n=1 Tax=Phenylobacterium koreense TaxID=266125 RepID=A0ABV2EI75_9CAUL
MDFFDPTYVVPILAAIATGGVIGYEREYRGRAAGIRTHILVCLTSTLLMLAAVHQIRWMAGTPHDVIRIDPVRMAHGVLTGIGFLCAGVIFREGFSVRGLTTAASLWITASLGLLYGISLHWLAITGTLATLLVLAGLRVADGWLPHIQHVDVVVRYVRGSAPTAAQFTAFVAEHGLKPDAVATRLLPDDTGVELASTLRGRNAHFCQGMVDKLLADPAVISFDVSPRHE